MGERTSEKSKHSGWSGDLGLRGLRKVADFSGRDTRPEFWLYAIAVAFVVSTIATGVAAIFMFRSFDGVELSGFGTFLTELRDLFMAIRLWATVAFIVLLAAAVARRMHDVGRSAWGALVPAGFVVATIAMTGRLFAELGSQQAQERDTTGESLEVDSIGDAARQLEDLVGNTFGSTPTVWDASFADLALVGLLGLVAVATAIPVLFRLARPGTDVDNQYGSARTDTA